MTTSDNHSGARKVLVAETFFVNRPPEVVFDYLTTPSNLTAWQTSKTRVEQLTEGPPQRGTRVRERTKPPGGRAFDQIVEFTDFERPARVRIHIVEGPHAIDGIWSLERDGDGTRVHFTAEGVLRGVLRVLERVSKRLIARQMAASHRNLRRNLEAG